MKLLNQNDFANNDLFSNLQGNILKGHGRDFTTNIFIKFDERRKEAVKKWIRDFSENKITSCKKQLKENELYKRNKVSGNIFYGFMLTSFGYQYFGKSVTKFEESFILGMEKADLKDPKKDDWEAGFKEEIHAMILVADDNQERLAVATREVVKELDLLGVISTIEYGNAIRNENEDGIEHFGYVDGVSQPLFFEDELEKYIEQNIGKNKFSPSLKKDLIFDPSADKNLVLVNDPLIDKKNAYGSYFVFRKLEQNVRKFKRDEEILAEQLGLKDSERAGAMIVGRFEDGTPVQVSDEDGMIGSGAFNNFDYDNGNGQVGDNSKCPFHAHIRKSNPRSSEADKIRIMARRGIPYGHRNTPTNVEQDFHLLPEEGVGLLFMSFQKSIKDQFEFIQRSWVNNAHFPNANAGLDPIIGQDGASNESKGMFPKVWGDTSAGNLASGTFESAVTMKGGEYFFAPSIPFLKTI